MAAGDTITYMRRPKATVPLICSWFWCLNGGECENGWARLLLAKIYTYCPFKFFMVLVPEWWRMRERTGEPITFEDLKLLSLEVVHGLGA
jgi:hypothetical protein